MTEKLTWAEIKQRYDGQWVQLVDYDWDDSEPYPSSGIVTVHAPTRKEFDQLTKQSSDYDAARLYVGEPKRHDVNTIISCNMHRITPA
jgi:hypothetical protein